MRVQTQVFRAFESNAICTALTAQLLILQPMLSSRKSSLFKFDMDNSITMLFGSTLVVLSHDSASSHANQLFVINNNYSYTVTAYFVII
jgi:hypothetical protein